MAGGNRKPQDVSNVLGLLIYNHSNIKEMNYSKSNFRISSFYQII
jgi:hypothetical protein